MVDEIEHLSFEEVGRLLGRQRKLDLLRLAALAETWDRGCPRREASDLLNEALARILSGSRPWPANVSLHAFLSQVMRSIASQWRHEDIREPLTADQDMDAADILCGAGYRPWEACDADDAVKILEAGEADIQIVFTDVQMPGSMDGFSLARTCAERWPHISVLVASGQVSPNPGDMPEGAVFINKPFSADVVHDWLVQSCPTDRSLHLLNNVSLLGRPPAAILIPSRHLAPRLPNHRRNK